MFLSRWRHDRLGVGCRCVSADRYWRGFAAGLVADPMNADQAKALRAPFPKEVIGQLPTGGRMLDFVGHAATTDRLLQVDPGWTWEPVAFDEQGLPRRDASGGLWIRLTVCDVTRLGYGDAGGKKGPNAVKEAIGDAIRNAAMRFGVALDLWSKQDLIPAESNGHANGNAVQSLKSRIWSTAKAKGWSKSDLETDFAANHNGLAIGSADEAQLAAYVELLEVA